MSNLFFDKYGNKRWRNDKGKLHRIDGPAVESVDGDKLWYFEGKIHRIDGPAIERFSGEYSAWYYEGKRHRIDGPAIEWSGGDKWWFFEGKRHRVDGPAVERYKGNEEYWYYGEQIDCHSTEEFIEIIKLKIFW